MKKQAKRYTHVITQIVIHYDIVEPHNGKLVRHTSKVFKFANEKVLP